MGVFGKTNREKDIEQLQKLGAQFGVKVPEYALRQPRNTNEWLENISQKLDKIIELLQKEEEEKE
jgi:hypothetical protein